MNAMVEIQDIDTSRAALGGFVISLDFELNWGVLSNSNVKAYWPNLHGARTAIPKLLDLFEEYGLACTWATTGLLFFDRRDHMLISLPNIRPEYRDKNLSSYNHLNPVGCSEESDPLHFGLSLINMIKDCPKQEIGTHTFSHYYCLDAGENSAPFKTDLDAARKAGAKEGVEFDSIVFPRNQVCDYALSICAQQGLTAFRGNAKGWAYSANGSSANWLPKRVFRLVDRYLPIGQDQSVEPVIENGMVNVAASCFLRPYSPRLALFERLRIARIKRAMRRAAQNGRIFHLWFHPHNFGIHQDENFAVMREIAKEAVRLDREFGWPSRTMGDVAAQVLRRKAA